VRTLVLLLLTAVLLAGLPADAKAPYRRCDFPWRQSTKAKTATVKCWSRERNIDAERVLRIGRCESGADLRDRYLADGHGGWSQQAMAYWPARAKQYGVAGASVNDTWAHARVATGMMAAGGWGHWSCR